MPPLQAMQPGSEEYSINTSATGAGSGHEDVETTQSIMASNTNFDQNVPGTIAPRAYIPQGTVPGTSMADFRHSVDAGRIHVEGSTPMANDELVPSDLQDHQMQLRPRLKPLSNDNAQLTIDSRKRGLGQQPRAFKHVRSEAVDQKDLSMLLKEITTIPQDIIQPQDVLA